jgi:DNA topoisomerase VI subunit B
MLSRTGWSLERQEQLRAMWDRGDSVASIAAALRVKPGTISVARQRLGLTPRRKVSGRPAKRRADEPGHKIDRVTTVVSRLMEFCSEKELSIQTGHPIEDWPLVIFKELPDNALDACEEAEVAPVIKIRVTSGKEGTKIVIEDNGPGVPAATLRGITDYGVRASSREAYVSPTRGAQGNALKTILAMGYVKARMMAVEGRLKNTDIKGETLIEAHGIGYRIRFEVNQIKQEPDVSVVQRQSAGQTGTRITVWWPENLDKDPTYPSRKLKIIELLTAFVWTNPHLTMTVEWNGRSFINCSATDPQWKKWRPRDATSAHWYTLEQFERYAAAHITAKRKPGRAKYTVREFIGEFRGMSGTEKQCKILRQIHAPYLSLSRFFGTTKRVNHDRMHELLRLLQRDTVRVRPEMLGVIGRDHLSRMLEAEGGEPKSFKYVKILSEKDAAVPYVIEVAFAVHKLGMNATERAPGRRLIQAANFSAGVSGNLFEGLPGGASVNELLVDLRASEQEPIIVFVHLTAPRVKYLDRGKSRITLDD